jgi:hypothetical protein
VEDVAGKPPYPGQPEDIANGDVHASPDGGATMCVTCGLGAMSGEGDTACAQCPQGLRCDLGQCEDGTSGRGCSSCAGTEDPQSQPGLRWYQGGQKCYPCGNTLWIVLAGGGFAASTVVYGLWSITKVNSDNGNMDAAMQTQVRPLSWCP